MTRVASKRHSPSAGGATRRHNRTQLTALPDEELAPARQAVALGRRSSASQVTALQAVAGNRAVQRLLDGPGISDDAAEGVGAMFTRAERSARPAGGPGISDDTAAGVGAMFTRAARQERSARAAQEDPLTARQSAAAREYEASSDMRKASWESQVKATLDAEQTGRMAPGQKLSAEQQALRFQAFVAKCDAEAQRLSGEAATADATREEAEAALKEADAIPGPFLTYRPDVAATMATAKAVVASGVGGLAAKASALRAGTAALATTRDNTTYANARQLTIGNGWLQGLVASLGGLKADLLKFSLARVRTAMTAIITNEWTTAARLAPTWAEKEKVKVASMAAGKIPVKTDFEAELTERVRKQHNPTKSEWLTWLKQGLGWDKWRHGLWGDGQVGHVAGYKVHATRFLDSMGAPGVDSPASDLYTALLGSGVTGFHVTMEVHGEMGAPPLRNPHGYRGGPVLRHNYVDPGGVPWSTAQTQLINLRNAAVAQAEARIKALKDVHGER